MILMSPAAIPFLCLVAVGIGCWLIVKHRKRMAILGSGIHQIDRMSGVEFEALLEILFSRLGYSVQTTPTTGDFGADLIAVHRDGRRIAVQAKRYSGNVGVAAVQEVVAAKQFYRCRSGIVVTNSEFTKAAHKLAAANHVELWDRDTLIKHLNGTQNEPVQRLTFFPLSLFSRFQFRSIR